MVKHKLLWCQSVFGKSISERFNEVGLVIIDPISRFRAGMRILLLTPLALFRLCNKVRDRPNTAVLCIHHANKGAKANGISQNNARGVKCAD